MATKKYGQEPTKNVRKAVKKPASETVTKTVKVSEELSTAVEPEVKSFEIDIETTKVTKDKYWAPNGIGHRTIASDNTVVIDRLMGFGWLKELKEG